MTGARLLHTALLVVPLVVIGFAAGVLYALSRRPGAPAARRRAFGVLWILTLLLGAPLWLFLAAALGF